MARIRSVHPGLFSDEAWVSCSAFARLLIIGLWTEADDQGVFEWKPLTIKMRLMPGDHVEVAELLDELVSKGLVKGFMEGGQSYGAVKDFQKYQRPQRPRPQFPLPDDMVPFVTGAGGDQADLFAASSGTAPPNSAGDSGTPQRISNQRRGEERRGKEVEGKPKGRLAGNLPEGFPDEEAISDAETKFEEARVDVNPSREAEKFRNFHAARGKQSKDWRASWRTWVANAIDYAERDGKIIRLADRIPDAEMQAKVHRMMFESWIIDREWNPERGPPPDEPGCKIPEAVMAEYAYRPGADLLEETLRLCRVARRARDNAAPRAAK